MAADEHEEAISFWQDQCEVLLRTAEFLEEVQEDRLALGGEHSEALADLIYLYRLTIQSLRAMIARDEARRAVVTG